MTVQNFMNIEWTVFEKIEKFPWKVRKKNKTIRLQN